MRRPWIGLRASHGQNNPIVCGRKLCTVCGRWRLVSDFPMWRFPNGQRLAPRCDACVRRYLRERYASETPEQRKLRLEYARFWKEAKRRERGARPNQRRQHTTVDRVERVFLPVEPLLPLIEYATDGYTTIAPLSARAGVSERAIYRWRHGESRHVRIDAADRLAVALGLTSSLIWQDEW